MDSLTADAGQEPIMVLRAWLSPGSWGVGKAVFLGAAAHLQRRRGVRWRAASVWPASGDSCPAPSRVIGGAPGGNGGHFQGPGRGQPHKTRARLASWAWLVVHEIRTTWGGRTGKKRRDGMEQIWRTVWLVAGGWCGWATGPATPPKAKFRVRSSARCPSLLIYTNERSTAIAHRTPHSTRASSGQAQPRVFQTTRSRAFIISATLLP
ncbi:hypothetical protein BS50DRAFT_207289 [Corynespora cassiicola Philippines]|uniref:Uncharacterized protein n=1 Tax=Corynespora cassiicola Philippines TaxID=1448308 RepID=A0A2T2N4I3_CORCC|nr:hypothetical protein BS50DRAFT_207289 [Corynespora cassiicola Philippines]